MSHLKEQLNSGNRLLYTLLREHRKVSTSKLSGSPDDVDQALAEEDDADTGAIATLTDSLHIGEELHERYTSEYAPDDRSIRFHRGLLSEHGRDSPMVVATPTESSESVPPIGALASLTDLTETDYFGEDEDESDVWPVEVLDRYIIASHERADRELEQGHYNQAEENLQSAIKYSEMRQRHYDIKFEDRIKFNEEVAVLYQKQHKWGEAVSKMHQLLRDSSDEFVQARQNQILASIYYDRHINKSGPALSNATGDIENAERHARKAFSKAV